MKNLIKAVQKIDPEAAAYLENVVQPRYDGDDGKFYKMIEGKRVKKDNQEMLADLLIWYCTPQKNPYWLEIFNKLG